MSCTSYFKILVKSASRFNVKRANFQNLLGGEYPLAGVCQVCCAHYASYIVHHLINSHFNVATVAMLFERSTLKPKPVDLFLLISFI